MIPVVSVVGYSGSGKTMVVVNLVKVLKRRGYRVAAVKHAPHGYEADPPGTDSFHCFQAGADKVVLAGPQSITVHERTDTRWSLPEVCARIGGVDFIVVEGFKREPGPKVGVFREGYSGDLASAVAGLIAVVGDYPGEQGVPCFSLDQAEELADFIVGYFAER